MPQKRTFNDAELNLDNNPAKKLYSTYQVGDFLSDQHVNALAKYEIARRLGMQTESVEHNFNIVTLKDKDQFNQVEVGEISIDSRPNVNNGYKPCLLTVSNNTHFVSIALLPDPVNPAEIHVIYSNSAANSSLNKCKNVGLGLANQLNQICNNNKYPLHQINLNPTQQIVNNCGPQTAFNHATIAEFYQQRNIEGKKRKLNMDELQRLQENQVCNRIATIPDTTIRAKEFQELVRTKFTAMENLDKNHIPHKQDLRHGYLERLSTLENKHLMILQQKHSDASGQINHGQLAREQHQINSDYKYALELQQKELHKAGYTSVKTERDIIKTTKASWQLAIKTDHHSDSMPQHSHK